MTAKTRVMLVDDHGLCRSGLVELLERRGNMTVVGSTGVPEQVMPMLRAQRPDLMVLDLRLATTDGLSLLRQMRAQGCETPVVILTMSDSEDDLSAALRAGVRGYLLKDMEPEEVIDAIVRAARGEMVVASAMTLKLAQILQSGPKGSVKGDLVASLTEREREVLEHVARGQSNNIGFMSWGNIADVLSNGYWSMLAQGIAEGCATHQYFLTLLPAPNSTLLCGLVNSASASASLSVALTSARVLVAALSISMRAPLPTRTLIR